MRELYKSYNEQNLSDTNEELYLNLFSSMGLLGGPTYPLAFPDFEKCPQEVKLGYQALYNRITYMLENNLSDKLLSRTEEDEKVVLSADDILSLFLIETSKIVNEQFYRTLVIFIRHYRECMNRIGWNILEQYKSLEYEPTHLDFTSVKNGDFLPEICNDFINIYLPENLKTFDIYLATVIVNYLCDWLYKFGFTKMKIKFMKDDNNK
jgi:hypothetical protein